MTTEQPATSSRLPPRWVVIVVGLLAAHFCFVLVMVRIATRESPGVIPNSYTEGVNWDKAQAKHVAAEKLDRPQQSDDQGN